MIVTASGLPVVTTGVRGTVEVIRDGVTGLLVEPADPVALAGAIERLARDPQLRLQLDSAARRETEERWSLEAMVARHAELYERLAR